MLNISSKRFVKTDENQRTQQVIEFKSHSTTANSNFSYAGKVFDPSTGLRRVGNNMSPKSQLVLSPPQFSHNFPKSGMDAAWFQMKKNSSSTLSVTTDASSDMGCNDVMSPNSGIHNHNYSSYQFKTPKTNGNLNVPCVNACGAFQSAANGFGSATSVNYQGMDTQEGSLPTGEQQKTAKKTRRGGKKARARREREKARLTGSHSPSASSDTSSDKSQVKYKTELCKNWIEKGKCSYSVRCMFAHGHHELVSCDKSEETKMPYKKALCEKFHNNHYCSYGTRCVYIHDERKVEDIQSSFFMKGLLLLDTQEKFWSHGNSNKRLPIFEKMTSPIDMEEESIVELGSLKDLETSTPSSVNTWENKSKGVIQEDLSKSSLNDDCLSCASDSTDTAESRIESISIEVQQDA